MLNKVLDIAQEAANIILHYYDRNLQAEEKTDGSPVTKADTESSIYIESELKKLSGFPVQSEENLTPYAERKSWNQYWLVDPLDGTKNFLRHNGQFTINIALMEQGRPTLGVVICPTMKLNYYANQGEGAFLNGKKISHTQNRPDLIGAQSMYHANQATTDFFLKNKIQNIVKYGSAIKMCKIAEGEIDIYPRLNGTSEWDTAAAEIILFESGCELVRLVDKKLLDYNKQEMLNPYFVAAKKGINWLQ